MSYTKEAVLAAYQRLGNLRAACVETGAPPYIAFIWCKKAGVMTQGDKSRYGTKSQQQGAKAEAEFQRLVPRAMPANSAIVQNCPGFDFDCAGVMVDVKYSSYRSTADWGFKTAIKKPLTPDLYAFFMGTAESGAIEDGYRLLLIPHELVQDKRNITIRPGRPSDLWEFEVAPAELSDLLMSGEGAR